MLLNKTEYIRAIYSVISGPQAFKVVVLARLTPVPFGLQNAVFSASRYLLTSSVLTDGLYSSLATHRYLLASVLGLLPTQSCNVYIGSTLRRLVIILTCIRRLVIILTHIRRLVITFTCIINGQSIL